MGRAVLTFLDGTVTGKVHWGASGESEEVCGPFDEGSGYTVEAGTYSTDGTAMTTPAETDGVSWRNPDDKFNFYFQLNEGGSRYAYSGVIDTDYNP